MPLKPGAQSEPTGFEGRITISLRSARRATRRLGEFVLKLRTLTGAYLGGSAPTSKTSAETFYATHD